jgi:hypothetical protein
MARAKNKGTNISKQPETCVKSQSVASDKQKTEVKPTKTDKSNNGGGRKPIFDKITPEFLDELTAYASSNMHNYEIAQVLGIGYTSFYKLMNESEDFRNAYNKGIDNRKFELEKALIKRATGFEAQETKTETDSEGNVIKKIVTDKSYVPDSTALIFSLKNLYSDKYKDRIESVNTVNVNIQQIQNIPDEELLKYADINLIDDADYQIE